MWEILFNVLKDTVFSAAVQGDFFLGLSFNNPDARLCSPWTMEAH